MQRYSVTRIQSRRSPLGRRENFTNLGENEHFRAFIGMLTVRDRGFFRSSLAGRSYDISKTLARLEGRYPGWNSKGEYIRE